MSKTETTAAMRYASIIADTIGNYLSVAQRKDGIATIAAIEVVGALKRAGLCIVEDQSNDE